jgi:fructose-bisphosphate aldolase class II
MLSSDIVRQAQRAGTAILAFNIPYLPMMRPVVEAIVHQDSVAMVTVARLEWLKFESRSPAAVREEFERWKQPEHVWLHLDHIPIIDEDGLEVDAVPVIQEAIALGYQSVMVDASRLPLEGNIQATRPVAEMAHAAGIPCEAELGAILGHEAGPLPPYEELFQSGRGFTDPEEARRFVQETGCDWLSVAAGNIHGAISGVKKDQKKVEARLNLERIELIARVTGIPLVLHGGSGIRQEYVLEAVRRGIAKINIATEIRQAYEAAMRETGSEASAQQAVYERTTWLIRDYYGFSGLRKILF